MGENIARLGKEKGDLSPEMKSLTLNDYPNSKTITGKLNLKQRK